MSSGMEDSRGVQVHHPVRATHLYLPRAIAILYCGLLTVVVGGCSVGGPAKPATRGSVPPVEVLEEVPELATSIPRDLDIYQRLIPSDRERVPLPHLPLPLTREVRRELENILRDSARTVLAALELRERYISKITEIFDDEGVPRDLINLAIVESCFRVEGRSPAGALGIWQFTAATAKRYGLRIGGSADQRKDPIRSSLAAARLLADLYRLFSDWHLALAAYNAGPAGVGRAMKRSGSSDFWGLSRSGVLNRQTAEFVPRVLATAIVVKVADRYGRDNLPDRVRAFLDGAQSQR